MEDSLLQKKIKEVLIKTGKSIAELAKASGFPKDNMYKWYKGTRPSDAMVYNRLISYLDKVLNEFSGLPVAEEPMTEYATRYKPLKVKISLSDPRKPPEPVNEKAPAGAVIVIGEEPFLIAEHIDMPFLGAIDGVIEMNDDSMVPVFKRGSRVAITRLPNYRILTWGTYCFVIDKNLQGNIRRINQAKTDDAILLESENARYAPITRQWEHIEAIFLIKAVVLKF